MTKRWRYWLSAAVIFGVVAFLAVVAAPDENLRIVVTNDSRERAVVQVIVQDPAPSVRLVWTGTAVAGETREIPLLAPAGNHLLHVVAQFPDYPEPKVLEDRTFIYNARYGGPAFIYTSLYGSRTYNFRFADENLKSSKDPPELSIPLASDNSLLPLIESIRKLPYRIVRGKDVEMRQSFRRWIVESPFLAKPGGGAG